MLLFPAELLDSFLHGELCVGLAFMRLVWIHMPRTSRPSGVMDSGLVLGPAAAAVSGHCGVPSVAGPEVVDGVGVVDGGGVQAGP